MATAIERKRVSLGEVFSPRGVAVVGVSGSGRGRFADNLLLALTSAGFPNIYPVNPKYKEVSGLTCYPDLESIPGVVDYVVVCIPAGGVMALLDQCAAKGVKAVHFFTAGFSESGDSKRAALEKEMLKKAKISGFRIIGPNCIGVFAPKSRLVNMSGVSYEPGPVAFISQSGGHAENIVQYSESRGIRFSKVVSYGNGLDVNETEMLEYFSQDPETKMITAYIEGVKDGKAFARALKAAAAVKPVVIYKGGRTETGKRAAFGHTASMTSSVAVFEALCRQVNAIQVDNIDEMIDVLTILTFVDPLPEGPGVGMIGAGGGPSVLAGDVMEKSGVCLPSISEYFQAALKKILPTDGSIFTNPLDTPNMLSPETISDAMAIMGKIPEVHTLFYHMGFHPMSSWGRNWFSGDFKDQLAQSLLEAKKVSGKPIILALGLPVTLKGMEEFLEVKAAAVKVGIPVFHSLENLAKAIARVVAWRKKKNSVR